MKRYIGVKAINARPMTRAEYNHYRGWDVPADEVASDEGYLVEYIDGGQANHPDHSGYISWSPKDVFDRAHVEVPADGIPGGLAMEMIKRGARMARHGWNGKAMFVFLVPGSTFAVNRPPLLGIFPSGSSVNYRPHIDLRAPDGSIGTWDPSTMDLIANDWYVVE